YLADQPGGVGTAGVGLQGDVGHPLDRDVTGGVGECAAVGASVVEFGVGRCHRAVQLVAHQNTAGDDVPGLGGHSLVVVADAGQAVFDGAVTGHVHHRRAVLQCAELVQGGEGGAGVVRLVPQGPVQFRGVADGLMDR